MSLIYKGNTEAHYFEITFQDSITLFKTPYPDDTTFYTENFYFQKKADIHPNPLADILLEALPEHKATFPTLLFS